MHFSEEVNEKNVPIVNTLRLIPLGVGRIFPVKANSGFFHGLAERIFLKGGQQ